MRDPKRIPRVIALLQEVWLEHPDLRLGQLVEAAKRSYYETQPIRSFPPSVFMTEDDCMEIGLLTFQARHKVRS